MNEKTKLKLKLIGEDGNAFSILGRARKVMLEAGQKEEFAKYKSEATSGDYDNLLQVTMKWFDVE